MYSSSSPNLVSYVMLELPWASLIVQLVKSPPAMWETWVQSLGWEDPLEKGKAPVFRILSIQNLPVFWPGEFHGQYGPWGHKELDTIVPLILSGIKF